MVVILSRDHALIVPLLSTYGTVTLLSRDGVEVQVPLALLLGASTLVRSVVAESHLHPGIHGPLFLSFAVAADVLGNVGDILGEGVSSVTEENIGEVEQVLNSLGIEAKLSHNRIINECEHADTIEGDIKLEIGDILGAGESTVKEENIGEVDQVLNLLGIEANLSHNRIINECEHAATIEGDIKLEMMFEPGSEKETDLSEVDADEANDNLMKECYVKIVKIAVCSFDQSCTTNTGEKPHTCTICNSSFFNRNQLRRHYRLHSDEKLYTSCNICNSSFTSPHSLRRHNRIHKGEKLFLKGDGSFSCDECNFSTARKDKMIVHKNVKHLKIGHQCSVCKKPHGSRWHLNKHMQTAHGDMVIGYAKFVTGFQSKIFKQTHALSQPQGQERNAEELI